MVNAAEAFKSEEAGATGQVAAKDLDFVHVGRAWKSQGIAVPEIFWVAADSRFILLEDFGDELLFARRQKSSALEFYKKALDQLVLIQKSRPTDRVSARSFSAELLTWEFEHFVEYALEVRKKPISAFDLQSLRLWMKSAVEQLSRVSPVVCHRDFHSKNLIVRADQRLGVIDFQDALMGPDTYDLASLLRDSYVRLEDAEEKELVEYFERQRARPIDRKLFGLMSLQRNMKAVGRFYYIQIVKGRDTHIPFVKPTMDRIFRTLRELQQKDLIAILEKSMAGDF
jgi:aminoglycoside/choline kinase family phosphotransferase